MSDLGAVLISLVIIVTAGGFIVGTLISWWQRRHRDG